MQIIASEVGLHSRVEQLANQNTSPNHKWFVLYDNKLDGSYKVLSANGSLEIGWWGTTLSNSQGVIASNPTIQFIYEGPTPIHSIGFVGSALTNDYPVDFTYELYSGSTLLHTETVNNNASVSWKKALNQTYIVTVLKLTIKKVNKANRPARLVEVTTPNELFRVDNLIGTVTYTVTSGSINPIIPTTENLKVIVVEQSLLGKSLYSVDALWVTDTQSKTIEASLTRIDSSQISIVEASLLKEKKLFSSDVLTLSEVASTSVQVQLSRQDTLITGITENAIITNSLNSTDTHTLSIVDSSFFVQYHKVSSDELRISSTEVTWITSNLISGDSTTLSTSEASNIPEKRIQSTDTFSIGWAESKTQQISVASNDSLDAVVSTAGFITATLLRTDSFMVNIVDTSFFVQLQLATADVLKLSDNVTRDIQVLLSSSDAVGVTTIEQALLREKYLYSADTLDGTIVPGGGIIVELIGREIFALVAEEVKDIVVQLKSSDSGVVTSLDVGFLRQYHGYSYDVGTVQIVDDSKVTVLIVGTDELRINDVVVTNITATVPRPDSLGVIVEELTGIVANLVTAETQLVNLQENSLLRQYHFYSGDNLVVNAVEGKKLQVELGTSDVLGISSAETRNITASFTNIETLEIVADNGSKVTVEVRSTDALSVNSAETSFVPTTHLVRSEQWSVTITDQRGTVVSFTRAVSEVIQVVESTDITVRLESFDTIAIQALLESGLVFGVRSQDHLTLEAGEDIDMTNIHTQMNADGRQVFAKVEVTYTDPFNDETVIYTASETGRYTDVSELADNISEAQYKWFSLHDNKLDGSYHPLPANREYSVGWWGDSLSDADGFLVSMPTITVTFETRALLNLRLVGNDKLNVYAVDFQLHAYDAEDTHLFTRSVEGNTQMDWYELLETPILGVAKIHLKITRINKAFSVAKLTEMFTAIKETYYADDIESIRLLEETGYSTGSLPIGNLSANEIDITLSNKRRQFDVHNKQSILHGYVKRNRRVQAWLGALIGEEIEWHRLGVFWTTAWDIGRKSLVARLTARDRLELLRLTDIETSPVHHDKTLYELFEIVLRDAGLFVSDYVLDPALHSITIPHAWFEKMSHRAALQRLASCSIIQVYCTKEGKIRVNLELDATEHVISSFDEDVNTFDVKYPIAVAEQVNHIQITTKQWVRSSKEKLYESKDIITIAPNSLVTVVLEFKKSPVLEIEVPRLELHEDIRLRNYVVYCWGMEMVFENVGGSPADVTNIFIEGYVLEESGKQIALAKDDRLIREDGKISVSHEHDFIQDIGYAQQLADKILDTFKESRSDVAIDNRGDVALRLGDKVHVINPDEDNLAVPYAIQRQVITWAGFLSATTECKKL